MAKRQNRKRQGTQTSEAEDAFVAGVFQASTWARENTQTLVLMGIVLAVVLGGIVYWVDFQADRTQQAVVQLEQIQQGIALGDPETAKVELQQYIQRFDGTPYAAEARLTLGELHLESGDPQAAVEVLEAADVSLREPIGIQIGLLKGKAYEASGDLETAEETFLDVADEAELGFQRTEALADVARLRESRDDYAGAADAYERILDGLEEGDPQRAEYRMRLAEARTAANV